MNFLYATGSVTFQICLTTSVTILLDYFAVNDSENLIKMKIHLPKLVHYFAKY